MIVDNQKLQKREESGDRQFLDIWSIIQISEKPQKAVAKHEDPKQYHRVDIYREATPIEAMVVFTLAKPAGKVLNELMTSPMLEVGKYSVLYDVIGTSKAYDDVTNTYHGQTIRLTAEKFH